MSDIEKLQKAVQETIEAGYQIDSEAFKFLSNLSLTDDPTAVIERALNRIEALSEKPIFIDKSFLEETIGKPETPKMIEEAEQAAKITPKQAELSTPEAAPLFHPYAKDVDSDLCVIEDATHNFSSNGTIEDYQQYFQDRFKRLERLLRQRIDVRAATPILEALKSQAKAKLKIVCMVTEKREAKQNIILTVEDLQASATVLITHKSSEALHRKAQMLLTDQVQIDLDLH